MKFFKRRILLLDALDRLTPKSLSRQRFEPVELVESADFLPLNKMLPNRPMDIEMERLEEDASD